MSKAEEAKRYLSSLPKALLWATTAWVLMFASGYPAEDWLGVFVVWYLSYVAVSYGVFKGALSLLTALARYTTRVANRIGVTYNTAAEHEKVGVVARFILVYVLLSLALLTVGASLLVTGTLVPLLELSDFGRQFRIVATVIFGCGLAGITAFFAVVFGILRVATHRARNSQRPQESRFRVSASTVDALNRLRRRPAFANQLFSL